MSSIYINTPMIRIDLKGILSIAGSFNQTTISDVINILDYLHIYNKINYKYTIDDILDVISYSKYILYDANSRIIINSLQNDSKLLFSTELFIEKMISLNNFFSE